MSPRFVQQGQNVAVQFQVANTGRLEAPASQADLLGTEVMLRRELTGQLPWPKCRGGHDRSTGNGANHGR